MGGGETRWESVDALEERTVRDPLLPDVDIGKSSHVVVVEEVPESLLVRSGCACLAKKVAELWSRCRRRRYGGVAGSALNSRPSAGKAILEAAAPRARTRRIL